MTKIFPFFSEVGCRGFGMREHKAKPSKFGSIVLLCALLLFFSLMILSSVKLVEGLRPYDFSMIGGNATLPTSGNIQFKDTTSFTISDVYSNFSEPEPYITDIRFP